jgi:hypothetical protein
LRCVVALGCVCRRTTAVIRRELATPTTRDPRTATQSSFFFFFLRSLCGVSPSVGRSAGVTLLLLVRGNTTTIKVVPALLLGDDVCFFCFVAVFLARGVLHLSKLLRCCML